MNRRQFFKLAGGTAVAAAAFAALPEFGRKIFLPPRGGWATDVIFIRDDLRMSLEDFERLIIKPAVEKMAKSIDRDAMLAMSLRVDDYVTLNGVMRPRL